MKLCIDCADEIPEDRLRLAQSTMRCVSCQEIHEIGWYEKQIRPSELKSKNIENTKEKNLRKKTTKSPINFFTCISCNYKKNQFIDRPCAWCGVSGQILDQNHTLSSPSPSLPVTAEQKNTTGLYFDKLGGVGRLNCNSYFSISITSFSHTGFDQHKSYSSGYQCRSCGKITNKRFTSPYKEISTGNASLKLDKLPSDERAARVSHLLSLKSLCERGMQNTPVDQWLSSWQHTVDSCNEELSKISVEEIDCITAMINKARADFKASLICECSENVSREYEIFCPNCKSTDMIYRMSAIT